MPAVPQAQSRPTYYAPNQMTQMRPNPRWQQGGRPQGFQGMPSAMRQSGPRPALRHLAPANAPASRGLPAAAQRVGVGTAAQNLAPRPPVAAPAPRAVPPYKYASSVRSPHPGVQPLQVPPGAGLGIPALSHAFEVFLLKLQATFMTQTVLIWNVKTWQLCLCQGHAGWFICLVLTSPLVARLAVRIFFLVLCSCFATI